MGAWSVELLEVVVVGGVPGQGLVPALDLGPVRAAEVVRLEVEDVHRRDVPHLAVVLQVVHRVEVGGRQADHGTLASGRLAVHLAASGLLAVAFVVPPAFVESPAYRGVSVPLVFSIHDLACAEDLLHGLGLGLRGELEIRLQVETLPRKLGGPWIQLRLQSQNGLLGWTELMSLGDPTSHSELELGPELTLAEAEQ